MSNSGIDSDLIRGHIDTIILRALFSGDRYGYDIIKEIEQKSGGGYKLKQPTLYSCLKRLESQGFIHSYWGNVSDGGRRKYYSLTGMGREVFLKNQTEWEKSKIIINNLITDRDFSTGYDFEQAQSPRLVSEPFVRETVTAPPPAQKSSVFENEDSSQEILTDKTDGCGEEIEFSGFDKDDEEILDELLDEMLEEIEERQQAEQQAFSNENNYVEVPDNPAYNPYYASQREEAAKLEELKRQEQAAQQCADKLKSHKFLDTASVMSSLLAEQTLFEQSYLENVLNKEYSPTPVPVFINKQAETDTEEPDRQSSTVLERAPTQVEAQSDSNLVQVPEKNEHVPAHTEFIEYNTSAPESAEETNRRYIAREYKNILSSLYEETVGANEIPVKATDNFHDMGVLVHKENAAAADELNNEKLQIKMFNNISESVRELGNDVKIRKHNDNGKLYNSIYYYFSNKLILKHYIILFAIMLLETIFTFLFVWVGLGIKQDYDWVVYVLSILLSLSFPIAAFTFNMFDPDKKKRYNFDLKSSVIVNIILMLGMWIIIYLLNVCFKMPVGFSRNYMASLLLPALLSTNLPISALIFDWLYKSKKYSAD